MAEQDLSLADIFKIIKPECEELFDRIEVAYWWLADHHHGQDSQSYASLCRLGQIYNPGMSVSEPNDIWTYNKLCRAANCAHG